MNTIVAPSVPSSPGLMAVPLSLWRQAWRGDPVLMAFACLLLAVMLPMAFGLALDDRMLRGAPIWLKPMKFALSLAVLAWTTAYFAAWVDGSQRRTLAVLRWTVITAAGFEIAYIALQAGRGEASHYNVGDPFHGTMYTLMGIGAVLLTASQGWLAWLVAHHARPGMAPAYQLSVVIGLAMAFVLGTAAGAPLSALQAPPASALPLFGWSLFGDLRPAHFVGLHAEQVLPVIGAWAVATRLNSARGIVISSAAAWLLLFAALFAMGLIGARPATGF